MELTCRYHDIVFSFALAFLLAWRCEAQFSMDSTISSRQLDSLLQEYAYGAFLQLHPRTGTPYDGDVPTNLTGVKVAALRLRCGSLRKRGVPSYKEFDIPTGVIIRPYVKRLAFVYQNLGNWSSYYYPLAGYTHLAPVLGLLAYNASNFSASNLPELDVTASSSPIWINFRNVRPAPSGFTAKCVRFDLNGSLEFTNITSSNRCSTFHHGHFAIVVNSTMIPAPSGEKHKSNLWKIIVSVVGGIVGLFLLSLLMVWLISYRRKKKLTKMQKREHMGVVLKMEQVGNARLPVAPMTRTQPVIENDFVP
ncbi:hypothetical protein AXF42_Ash010588 [Apostasia shenzhenica]|uniref:Uncharacterized protein n=1 Tax=Apostasia shenzhenica TaxID=1088818 RepID=A0A2I0A6J3_9ASPA|nr:hypothetical protein AXF42_Ash010588 [Apostasia shenzhenica]